MTADPFGIAQGKWKRFSAYEVRDRYIRPAGGATLHEYDPWEGFNAARYGALKHKIAPYESLLDLLRGLKLKDCEHESYTLTAKSEADILSWCGTHGLLGLLLHQVRSVSLWPRWRMVSSAKVQPPHGAATASSNNTESFLQPTQDEFLWEHSQWEQISTTIDGMKAEASHPGEVVSEAVCAREFSEPGVFLWKGYGRWAWEPLTTTWGRFFPSVPEEERAKYSYPRPGSNDFWWLYGEPLQEFLRGAWLLEGALDDLVDASINEGEKWKMSTGIEAINELLTPTSPSLRLQRDRKFSPHWVTPSLLGTFTAMAFCDLTESRRAFTCACCGKLRASSAYQARYCSQRCGETMKKRRQRARKG